MDPNPKKRPFAHHIVNKLDKTASIVETSITSPSAEQQVRSLKEQHGQRKTVELSFEYLSKDMNGRAKPEEPMEFIGAFRDH